MYDTGFPQLLPDLLDPPPVDVEIPVSRAPAGHVMDTLGRVLDTGIKNRSIAIVPEPITIFLLS